jgi:hypothetical protein
MAPPKSGMHTAGGLDLKFRADQLSPAEITARTRSLIQRTRLRTVAIAADTSVPVTTLETVVAAISPPVTVRLYVRLTPETVIDRFLLAFPDTPARAVKLLRARPGLNIGDALVADLIVAATQGCPEVRHAFGAIEDGGISTLAGPLADALERCNCKMTDVGLLDALIAYTCLPRNDVGWLPLRFSISPDSLDLHLGQNATLDDLVTALGAHEEELDMPIMKGSR